MTQGIVHAMDDEIFDALYLIVSNLLNMFNLFWYIFENN